MGGLYLALIYALLLWGLWELSKHIAGPQDSRSDSRSAKPPEAPKPVSDLEPRWFPKPFYSPPVVPKARRSWGLHHDPLTNRDCAGEFEQFDDRTWQCTLCHLLRFERPENPEGPTTKTEALN